MKILLTGATGYIGKRLLPVLLENGHQVVCCVGDKSRFRPNTPHAAQLEVVEVDFLKAATLAAIPTDLDGAYYLLHSMSATSGNFEEQEALTATNFSQYMSRTQVKHVVYLSGIVNDKTLSRHLASRKHVEDILAAGSYNFTTLRAGIIVGSGSASFEIMRDLVEKLPVMVAPKWLNTRCQPIGIRDVITFLHKTLLNEKTFNQSFDIGGPDILSYRQMLLTFAEVRQLKRYIITVPVLTPRLSSYWLYFVTSVSYPLAVNLVNSMMVEVICKDNRINELLQVNPLSFREAIATAFRRIDQNLIISSWKDSLISGNISTKLSAYIQVPAEGCFKDKQQVKISDPDAVMARIWSIGGDNGWYAANWLWQLRGLIDKLVGGTGLRRGRTSPDKINTGDALDFWRVILADKEQRRLLLYAEMKLPGEAWLEFRIENNILYQEATFRPRGVKGRLYWYAVLPFHFFIFKRMAESIADVNYKK
ncbi:SDR family oxidoreductase [Botryobacter ruber]|uniref:SDR family oxidoreductase n=1 Tax=Botryobacter ruber TaxID=2171629 RepID=UPI000E0CAFF1|nr:SDR family oxidoreductase [Botryobacter ruber]